MKVEHSVPVPQDEMQPGSMDSLLAKLSEQQTLLAKQKTVIPIKGDDESHAKEGSSASSALLTPASESFSYTNTANTAKDEDDNLRIEASEMARLKKELDDGKDQIARQKQELDQSRVIKHTFDQAMGPPSEVVLSPGTDITDPSSAFVTSNRPLSTRQGHWRNEDARSDGSDAVGPFSALPNAWSDSSRPSFTAIIQPDSGWGQPGPRPWSQRGIGNALSPPVLVSQQPPMQQRNYSVPVSPVSGGGGRGMNEFSRFNQVRGYGQIDTRDNRNAPPYQRGTGWDVYTGGPGPLDGMSLGGMSPSSTYQSLGMYPSAYQPRPIGTPLSPTAAEFRVGQVPANPWNSAVSHVKSKLHRRPLIILQPPASPGQTYVSPMEPLNYRRLLDRSVTCNWKYIVDKIVCNNDQQASIFLQQKLKVGTVEQKYEIIEAIVAQAYPLMVNRFGNFLVQRCFEHGTSEQVIAIANAIRGNTLSLSMDAFGCHVVQKAFDAVPEEYKALMVHELLRRIPETVIHRYACHVWQKLFELRWSDSPPQIMKYVNEALCGMWHEVALGETGSLVVQNIFENCLEEDKVCLPPTGRSRSKYPILNLSRQHA